MKLPFLDSDKWRWRWMYEPGENVPDEIHRVKSYQKVSEEYSAALEEAITVCGQKFSRLFMPGMFSRLGAPRCESCCHILNIPTGYGAPNNSDITEPEEIDDT